MDEKLTKRDRRFPWGVIPWILSIGLGFFLTVAYYGYIWGILLLPVNVWELASLLVYALCALVLGLFSLVLGGVLFAKARGILLTAVLAFGGVCYGGVGFVRYVSETLSQSIEHPFDRLLGFWWSRLFYWGYSYLPLALAFLLLALVVAGEIGKGGRNPLFRVRGVFSGLAFVLLGIHSFAALFPWLYRYIDQLPCITFNFLEPPRFYDFHYHLYCVLQIFAVILELVGIWAIARWVVGPYKRKAPARLLARENEKRDPRLRFPAGAVFLLISAFLPFVFSVFTAVFQEKAVVSLSLNALFGNVAFLVTLALAVVLLLGKRKAFLTAALGAKCAACATIPLAAWTLQFFLSLLFRRGASLLSLSGELVLIFIEGVPLVLTILFLMPVAAGEIGKNGKNPFARTRRVWLILSLISIVAFFVVTLFPASFRAGMSIGHFIAFLGSDFLSRGDIFAQVREQLFPVLFNLVRALVVGLKVCGWLAIADWVAVYWTKPLPATDAEPK